MQANPAADQSAPTVLNDEDARDVMRRLQQLLEAWTYSNEFQNQQAPCCLHGTCVRRLNCSGSIYRVPAAASSSEHQGG